MFEATLYDGITALPHQVQAVFGDDQLKLQRDDGWSDLVPSDRLRRLEGGRNQLRLSQRDHPGWRLILPAEAEDAVTRLIGGGERYGRWIDRIGLWPALAAAAVVTSSVVAIGYLAPNWVAPHVPRSWERNLGNAIVGDFGDYRCRSKPGQRALDRLVDRLSPGARTGPEQVRIAALDVPVWNAAALPGGHIVVFNPAITETENVEALAGIVAHEIAHVQRRHVTEALIRELGIGALIRLFAGDIGANAQQLVSLSYTRANEEEADRDAIAMLNRAGISPEHTAQLFDKLAEDMNEDSGITAEFLQSHPMSRSRARRFRAGVDKDRSYGTALAQEDADALFNVCWKGPAEAPVIR